MSNTYKVVIVDDDIHSIDVVEQFCKIYDFLNITGKFTNPLLAYDFVENNSVDLIFLNVKMPEMTGLLFVSKMNKIVPTIIISFCKDYAFEFFKYDFVFGYLIKPLVLSDFHERIQYFLKENKNKEANPDYLFVNQNKVLIRLLIDDIYLIEARADYIYIKTEKENYIVKSSLKNVISKLPENFFIRVHKSYVVNVTKINSVNQGVIIINKEHIPLSKSNYKDFLKKLNCL